MRIRSTTSTTGGWESHYGERGINGPIDDVLFPVTHGILHYPGFDVLPSFVVYRTSKTDAARFERLRQELGKRLDGLWSDPPIAFRKQNGGDYDLPALTLKPGVEEADLANGESTRPRADGAIRATGFRLHVRRSPA